MDQKYTCTQFAPKSYQDLGFTDEEFLEIADFFGELMRMDRERRRKNKLVQVLQGQLLELINQHKLVLLGELSGLEKLVL